MGQIEFEEVTFAFDGGEPVLRNVSFEIRPGQTLAILGPQGSGKSTIVHLLLRLYDYTDGSIRIDGRELTELSRRFVRSRAGVVLQEPFLYSKTVEENIRVGRAAAERKELMAVTAEACMAESIESFEKGYETMVGERGVTLSGGQRQRVALARALLRDPDVLILDDALSAVDTTTEARILDALRSRRGRATTIVIAHRLSTVVHADRILVLDHGRIEQQGTHKELVQKEGAYARLWNIQGALEDELRKDLRLAGSRGEKR
jgi:ATP-binding cassette subfamily B protein